MRILVVGDRITDQYSFCKATRFCPEAPAPVLVVKEERTSEGGAALISANIRSLSGGDKESIRDCFGSISLKHRIFIDRFLHCRIDRDSYSLPDSNTYWNAILANLAMSPDAVVVGDYGKGAMTKSISTGLVSVCNKQSIPLFVDAKGGVENYVGCYAIFPNENENNGALPIQYKHIIRKRGAAGCSVDGVHISTEQQLVWDETGAGDVFIAAFVVNCITQMIAKPDKVPNLEISARFANAAAGVSVKHLGTYVVKPEEVILL